MKQEGTHNTMMNNPTLMTCPVTAKAIKTKPHATNAAVVTTAAGAMTPHDTHDVAIENTHTSYGSHNLATGPHSSCSTVCHEAKYTAVSGPAATVKTYFKQLLLQKAKP